METYINVAHWYSQAFKGGFPFDPPPEYFYQEWWSMLSGNTCKGPSVCFVPRCYPSGRLDGYRLVRESGGGALSWIAFKEGKA